jgi:hypothetical protein
VALLAVVADPDALMAASQSSKELADVMECDGVLPGSPTNFVEA